MQIELSKEADEFIQRAIKTGRHRRAEVRKALELWIERERRREELLAALDVAEASVARGAVRVMPPGSGRKLAAEIHRRGMARLAAKKARGA